MKKLKIFSLLLVTLLGVITACKDDSIEIVPEWESAVHGLAEVTSSNTDFLFNDPNVDIDVDLSWISIDSKLTVTRIELFVLYDENYVDGEGNPKVAKHGGDDGRSLAVFEGSAVPANRTPLPFSVSQATLYNLYQDARFDYGDGEVSVFANPDKPMRNDLQRFMWDDKIKIRWEFTTDDGRVFDKWGVSVCTEFPGANCSVDLGVVCAPEIVNPGANGGVYTFQMVDTYGDGWQGGYISVIVDGEEFTQVNIPSQYDGNPPTSALTSTVTVPASATSLEFEWSEDEYNAECEFKIISPKGNVIANAANPTAGKIKLDLCLE
jgi:hypothetical protein